MTLSCDKPFSTGKYGAGIHIAKAKVISVEDISGKAHRYMQMPCDIGIVLTLDISKSFQPELIISGMFKRNVDTGEVIGWGGAFVVQEALLRLGYTGLLDAGNKIPKAALNALVGKEILRLAYVSGTKDGGKLRYSDWAQIGTPSTGEQELANRFRQSVTRGYPRNYHPSLMDGTPMPDATVQPLAEIDTF
jgi:hypothetical protein